MLRLQRTAVTAAEVDGIVTTCFPLVRDGLEFDCGPEAFSQRASIYSAALSMLDLELHLSLTANIIVIIIIINTNIVEALPPVQLPAYTLPRTVSRTLGRTDVVTRALSILRFFSEPEQKNRSISLACWLICLQSDYYFGSIQLCLLLPTSRCCYATTTCPPTPPSGTSYSTRVRLRTKPSTQENAVWTFPARLRTELQTAYLTRRQL